MIDAGHEAVVFPIYRRLVLKLYVQLGALLERIFAFEFQLRRVALLQSLLQVILAFGHEIGKLLIFLRLL